MSDQDIYRYFDNAVLLFAAQLTGVYDPESINYTAIIEDAITLAQDLCAKLGRPWRDNL